MHGTNGEIRTAIMNQGAFYNGETAMAVQAEVVMTALSTDY